jgi:hypothetical protein
MRRLCVLALAVCFGAGCAAEGDRGQWDEFWKDLRGDNMRMRYDRDALMGDGPRAPRPARPAAAAAARLDAIDDLSP